MNWPTPQDYNEAIQNPASSFADDMLKSGRVALNPVGLPKAITGSFASVYKLSSNGEDFAVRCFLTDRAEQKGRYLQISEFVLVDDLDCTIPFHFIEKGIQVKGSWYPIVKMDWVAGDTLDEYVRKNYKSQDKIIALHSEFRKSASELERAGIAHGDLQHGNIIVTSAGDMRLVDYDGLFVPALLGKDSLEVGHPNYQHPRRTEKQFDTTVDNFSCWLISSALRAIAIDPELFRNFGFGDESILFKRTDLAQPGQSELFNTLLNHSSPELQEISRILLRMLWEMPEKIPELSATSKELEQLPTVQPGTDLASLSRLLEHGFDPATEYDTNPEDPRAGVSQHLSSTKQNRADKGVLSRLSSALSSGASSLLRHANPLVLRHRDYD